MTKDDFAKALGIPKEDQKVLDSGGSHDYRCKCETCRKWWKLMGPDEDRDGNPYYGPFTKEEVEK